MANKEQVNYERVNSVTVELIDCVRRIKKGKACGPDNFYAEHFIVTNPSLIVHLKEPFQLILTHSFVPTNFGNVISIPSITNKTGNISSMDNYRDTTFTKSVRGHCL